MKPRKKSIIHTCAMCPAPILFRSYNSKRKTCSLTCEIALRRASHAGGRPSIAEKDWWQETAPWPRATRFGSLALPRDPVPLPARPARPDAAGVRSSMGWEG